MHSGERGKGAADRQKSSVLLLPRSPALPPGRLGSGRGSVPASSLITGHPHPGGSWDGALLSIGPGLLRGAPMCESGLAR